MFFPIHVSREGGRYRSCKSCTQWALPVWTIIMIIVIAVDVTLDYVPEIHHVANQIPSACVLDQVKAANKTCLITSGFGYRRESFQVPCWSMDFTWTANTGPANVGASLQFQQHVHVQTDKDMAFTPLPSWRIIAEDIDMPDTMTGMEVAQLTRNSILQCWVLPGSSPIMAFSSWDTDLKRATLLLALTVGFGGAAWLVLVCSAVHFWVKPLNKVLEFACPDFCCGPVLSLPKNAVEMMRQGREAATARDSNKSPV